MKYYAKIESERTTKGQGGKYLNIEVYTTNKENPTHLLRVRDSKDGNILIDFSCIFFGKERVIARECLYINKR